MSEETFEFPPLDPAIFAEIASLLPEGHLKTYWEGLASIQNLPKDDPIVVAIVAMGIMTIIGRQVPEEMAHLLNTFKGLMHQPTVVTQIERRLDEIKVECQGTIEEIRAFKKAMRLAKETMDFTAKNVGLMIDMKVKEATWAQTYFDRHPLAIAYLSICTLTLGGALGYLVGHSG